MQIGFYKPEKTVLGPAYGPGFKLIATMVCVVLAGYGITVALRYPLLHYGMAIQLLLLGAALMLGVSYYWFLRSIVTIDERGIRQTWMFNREVEWREVRGAKMIGIPFFTWLFPPRLVVRTGNSFATFNGGSRQVLIEFARISLAYQMKK
jgi:hypothetical protein